MTLEEARRIMGTEIDAFINKTVPGNRRVQIIINQIEQYIGGQVILVVVMSATVKPKLPVQTVTNQAIIGSIERQRRKLEKQYKKGFKPLG